MLVKLLVIVCSITFSPAFAGGPPISRSPSSARVKVTKKEQGKKKSKEEKKEEQEKADEEEERKRVGEEGARSRLLRRRAIRIAVSRDVDVNQRIRRSLKIFSRFLSRILGTL